MKLLKQFENLVVDDFEEAVYSYPDHGHTYYEIVYIHKGSGKHYLNQNILPYQAGNCFLLSPGDHHYFDIAKSTHFTFIKFTDTYFRTHRSLCPDLFSGATPESVMQLKAAKETLLKLEGHDKIVLRKIVESIVCYNEQEDSSSPVVFYQLLSLLSLLKKALQKIHILTDQAYPGREELSSYIHQHIYNREALQISQVAAHFNISSTYFSTYFKRSYNISYRDYLERYRMQLVEKRLGNPIITLKQIIQEFGFTDESHFGKAFKKHKGVSPSRYRKDLVELG